MALKPGLQAGNTALILEERRARQLFGGLPRARAVRVDGLLVCFEDRPALSACLVEPNC